MAPHVRVFVANAQRPCAGGLACTLSRCCSRPRSKQKPPSAHQQPPALLLALPPHPAHLSHPAPPSAGWKTSASRTMSAPPPPPTLAFDPAFPATGSSRPPPRHAAGPARSVGLTSTLQQPGMSPRGRSIGGRRSRSPGQSPAQPNLSPMSVGVGSPGQRPGNRHLASPSANAPAGQARARSPSPMRSPSASPRRPAPSPAASAVSAPPGRRLRRSRTQTYPGGLALSATTHVTYLQQRRAGANVGLRILSSSRGGGEGMGVW